MATRPCSPEAQHAPSLVHSTESKLPVSKAVHERPPSVETSEPDGPTASTVRAVRGTHAEPDR